MTDRARLPHLEERQPCFNQIPVASHFLEEQS
jgi:hypothetical protein